MGNQHGRAILQRQCAACRGDLQTRRLKQRDDLSPTGAVRPRSVDQHDVARLDRHRGLGVGLKSAERCCEYASGHCRKYS